MLVDRKFQGELADEPITHIESRRTRTLELADQLEADAQTLLDGLEDPEKVGAIVAHLVQAASLLRKR
jgi:hypothetical protein